ncbi:hypothetical protein D3C80_1234410 [compost metagenome]
MFFKAGNQRHQMLHLGDVFGRSQQEQDRIKVAFLRYYAVFAQIVGQNGRRNTEIAVVTACRINARRGEQQFARVDKILRLGIAFKGMPFFTGNEVEEAQIVGHRLGIIRLPGFTVDLVRHKGLD